MPSTAPFEILNFTEMPGVPCPCGTARRALMNDSSVPYSFHLTEISENAKVHYHKQTTETYFVLDCDSNASIELDGELFPIKPNEAIVIRPGTRHRAVGKMKVIIVASPKFDPADEWLD